MTPQLRLARPGDSDGVAAIYAPVVRDTAISFETEPPDPAEMQRRMDSQSDRTPWLVAERDRKILGYAYAGPHRARAAYSWSVEVSVYIDADSRESRLGNRLYRALLAIVEAQGFHRAFAGITLPNAASVALHESLGFEFVGRYHAIGWKQGSWHDVGWWERQLATLPAPPAPPIPLAVWRETDAGRRTLDTTLGSQTG